MKLLCRLWVTCGIFAVSPRGWAKYMLQLELMSPSYFLPVCVRKLLKDWYFAHNYNSESHIYTRCMLSVWAEDSVWQSAGVFRQLLAIRRRGGAYTQHWQGGRDNKVLLIRNGDRGSHEGRLAVSLLNWINTHQDTYTDTPTDDTQTHTYCTVQIMVSEAVLSQFRAKVQFPKVSMNYFTLIAHYFKICCQFETLLKYIFLQNLNPKNSINGISNTRWTL